jgi:hypothetical protein
MPLSRSRLWLSLACHGYLNGHAAHGHVVQENL